MRTITILIVDDEITVRQILRDALVRVGYTVELAGSGQAALECLRRPGIDLLILDLDMPTHDGIELCLAVRTDPQWANLPILFLTADTAAPSIDRVFAAGADDFVTKPVVAETLITRVFNRLKRSGFVLERGAGI